MKLKTLRGWSIDHDSLGYRLEEDGETLSMIWCKLCSKHAKKVEADGRLKGRVLKQWRQAYVEGTKYITKDSVTKHFLESQAHSIAASFEKLETETVDRPRPEAAEGSSVDAAPPPRKQPRIDDALKQQSRIAYRKLLNTAYIMAIDGMPLSSFHTLVKVQKANGVNLLQGVQDSKKAKELVWYLADAIREKLAIILSTSRAYSVLTDRSQARKTGSEKELVFVRVVRGGLPVYYVVALQDIDEYGNATAEHIKSAIDDAFMQKIHCSEESYSYSMISATSDGASVNFGLYNGVLTRMKASRPWLLTVHCALHRVELSLGDSLKKFKSFKDMQDYMITLFYTFKQSGNLKRCFKDTAKGLGVTSYNFPKVHGTRFIAHTRRGLDHLLKNWICLANTIESMTANKQHGNIKNLSAKLGGILKRLTDFRFLAFCCFYSNVLDIMSELSLRLEDSNILVFEVAPLVEMAISRITEIIDNPDSILLHEGKLPAVSLDFRVNDSSANGMGTSIECDLVKRGDMRKKPQNRETNRVQLENMKFVNGTNDVIRGVSRQLREIKECLGDRFGSFREEEVYSNMSWVDPANWQQTPEEDLVQIEKLSEYFHVPLSHKDFDASKVRREWKDLRILARSFYSGCNCRTFWKQIFQYRQKAFPNICVLVEHVLCIGATNGLVEAGFSHLTSMLSDRRLSTGHTTMENLLLIKINDFSWSDQDREEIIDSALEKYLMKRRVRRLESNTSFQSVMSRGLDLKQVEEEDDTREDGATTADDESDLESLMSSAEEDDIGLKDEDDDPLDDLGLDVEDYSNVLDPDHSHMDEDNRLS